LFVSNSYGNLISEPGFENGSSQQLWGGSTVVGTNVYSGSYAAQLDDSSQWGGGYEQIIDGLSPNTTYLFSAYVKSNGGEGRIGAKDFGATESYKAFSNRDYQRKSIRFTTGFAATSATIYVYNPASGAQYIYADELVMVIPIQTIGRKTGNTPTGPRVASRRLRNSIFCMGALKLVQRSLIFLAHGQQSGP